MFNLFYEPDYGKRKKKFFTLNFSNSVLLNIYIDFSYLFNFILIDKFITNGPLKLMNNILKSVKGKKVSINKILSLSVNKYILTTEKDFGRLSPKIDNRDIFYIEVSIEFPRSINYLSFDETINDFLEKF